MLKTPPCIRLLVGCLETDSFGGGDTSDDTGTTGLTLGGSPRSSSSYGVSSSSRFGGSSGDSSFTSSSVRSTLGDLSARLPSFASGTLIGRSAKLYTAHYLIKAKNIGSQALSGVQIAHGPLPFGAEFDASRSDTSCILNSKTVECTIDLASGAQKELSLVYKAGGSMSCSFARLLEKARATVHAVTGSTNANQVVTSVTCRMESMDSASSQSSLSNSSVLGTGLQTTQGTGATATKISKDSGYKQDYKPYTAVLPRTGVMHDYFASVGTDNRNMIIQRQYTESSISALPVFVVSILSASIVFVILKRSFTTLSTRNRENNY